MNIGDWRAFTSPNRMKSVYIAESNGERLHHRIEWRAFTSPNRMESIYIAESLNNNNNNNNNNSDRAKAIILHHIVCGALISICSKLDVLLFEIHKRL